MQSDSGDGGRCRVTVVVMEGGAEWRWREVQSDSGCDGGRCRVTVVMMEGGAEWRWREVQSDWL